MGQSSEQYIELCEEWVNINPITGWQARTAKDAYHGNPDYDFGRHKTPQVIRRKIKKKI